MSEPEIYFNIEVSADDIKARLKRVLESSGYDVVDKELIPKPKPKLILGALGLSAMITFDPPRFADESSGDPQYYLQRTAQNGKRKRNPNRWK